MTKLKEKILSLSTFTETDLAFLQASADLIAENDRARKKIHTALQCLHQHTAFNQTVLEFYLRKSGQGKARRIGIEGIPEKTKGELINRSLKPNQKLYRQGFNKQHKIIQDTNLKFKEKRKNLISSQGLERSIIMPINSSGFLIVSYKNQEQTSEYELNLLERYAQSNIRHAIELALDNETNYRLAVTDGLTGLFNHRYFKESLERIVSRQLRIENCGLSLVMMDIDDFKKYNDRFGHPEGDKVLRRIANIIRQYTRKSDLAARYGGEEFAILYPDTRIDNSLKKAESLREQVENTKFPNAKKGEITLSLGIANMPKNKFTDHKHFLSSADKALYHSKHRGKNKTTTYPI